MYDPQYPEFKALLESQQKKLVGAGTKRGGKFGEKAGGKFAGKAKKGTGGW